MNMLGFLTFAMTFLSFGFVSYKRTAAEMFCGPSVSAQAAANAWVLLHRFFPRAAALSTLIGTGLVGFFMSSFDYKYKRTPLYYIANVLTTFSFAFNIYLTCAMLAGLVVHINAHVYSVRCVGKIVQSNTNITYGALRRHYTVLCISLRHVSELWGPPLFLLVWTLILFVVKCVCDFLLRQSPADKYLSAFLGVWMSACLLLLIYKLSLIERERESSPPHDHLSSLLECAACALQIGIFLRCCCTSVMILMTVLHPRWRSKKHLSSVRWPVPSLGIELTLDASPLDQSSSLERIT